METIGMTKVKNAFKRHNIPVTFKLSNTRINGEFRGCSGFIIHEPSGRIAYVDTEQSCFGPLSDKFMYRSADSLKDYKGHRNRWTDNRDIDSLVMDIDKMFHEDDRRFAA